MTSPGVLSQRKEVIAMTASLIIAIGVWAYLVFGLSGNINYVADAGLKKAEAEARGKEADMKRAEYELERAKLEAG